MKKAAANKPDEFKKLVHTLWDKCDDEMDRLELKGFIDNENQPKMADLNSSDNRIGVEEVLTIGAYMVLSRLYHELHSGEIDEIDEVKANVERMLNGEVELREIAPGNIPEELLDALEGIVELGRDLTKKPRGKKK